MLQSTVITDLGTELNHSSFVSVFSYSSFLFEHELPFLSFLSTNNPPIHSSIHSSIHAFIHLSIHPSIHNQSIKQPHPSIHFSLFTASFVSTSIVRLFTYSIVSSTRTPNSLSSSGTSSLASNYASLPPSTPTYKPGSTQNETPAASGVLQLIVGVSMLSSPM